MFLNMILGNIINISGVIDATASTVVRHGSGRSLTLVRYTTSLTYPYRKRPTRVKSGDRGGHLDRSTFLWIADLGFQWQVSRSMLAPHLAGRRVHQIPVAQHSSLAREGIQHLSPSAVPEQGIYWDLLGRRNIWRDFTLFTSNSLHVSLLVVKLFSFFIGYVYFGHSILFVISGFVISTAPELRVKNSEF
jgi:hypothetical protein